MQRSLITQLLILLMVFAAPGGLRAAAGPRASVDRNVVAEGDSLTLTIRIEDTGSFDAPDYSVLQRDFEVYGNSESSQHMLNNGRLESWTEWQTTLLPKRSGELTIPPIAAAGGKTQALTIRVDPASANNSEDASEPVFMETQLDRQSIYVQQQLIFTVRIFHAIQLDEMHLSEPAFDNASVRKIAENTFRRDIKGSTYLVHELSYAIFPQQPGDLTIPELVFSAVQPTTRRSLFDFPGQGRGLRKMSKQLHATVKPIPKTFTGAVWLPAKNLTLTESRNANAASVGESITRNITIRADGLLAAQLPALDAPQLDNAKVYNDQPTLDDQQDASGIHSKRIENMALIPSKTGNLQLPELRVVWWDVESDSEKVATLPASTLRVAAGAQNDTAAVVPESESTTKADETAPFQSTAAPARTTALELPNRWLQAAILVLTLAWLITLYLYWRLRRTLRPAAQRSIDGIAVDVSAQNEDAAFRMLKDHCRAGNAAAARMALITWAQQRYRAANLQTLDQLLRYCDNAALTREVQQLDNRLFGLQPDSGTWNGENLLSVVRELRDQRAEKSAAAQQLPPLYPSV
jgi:oxygen tolerance protein BatD